jgi:type II secretory pathway component PulM
MACGLLALTIVPTVASGIAKDHVKSDITTQGGELAKYQPILAMYKSVSSETTPIRTAEAEAPNWTKVWQFLQATQPAGAIVTNLEMTESTPGMVTVDFSAEIPSKKPFAPVVAWINTMKSHGAISVQTSTMTYSASNGIQTTSFSLDLNVGSVSGVELTTKSGTHLMVRGVGIGAHGGKA